MDSRTQDITGAKWLYLDRLATCPMKDCPWRGPLKMRGLHVREAHDGKAVVG